MVERRRPLISANWKMNLDHREAIIFVQKLAYLVPKEWTDEVDVSIHPPFTDIRSVQTTGDNEKNLKFDVGAQNCHWEDTGAFTGEVSPAFLSKLDVRYVIVGHSERRELFGETDEMVAKKVTSVIRHGMTPILCVGETLDEREAGENEAKVVGQLRAGLAGRTSDEIAGVVVAYEPIWAIGTGRTATAVDAQEMAKAIRSCLESLADRSVAAQIRIQYGGSVKAANAAELMGQADIDGALVGGASLDPEEFARIVGHRHQ